MSEDDRLPTRSEADGQDGPATARLTRRRATLIKISTRMGVWGFVVALVPVWAEVLEAPIGVWRAMQPLVPGGLLASGSGIVLACALVLRSLPPGLSALKVAAIAGMPLGVMIAAVPVAALAPLSRFADVVADSGSLALLLGVLVVVALLVGFLRRGRA